MKICVVGATGLVGREMIAVLEEQGFGGNELIPVASGRSVGKTVSFAGKDFSIVDAATAVALKPEIALFSAGASVSREWAPKFAASGTFVIDNSSAWRKEKHIPLVVPEINAEVIGTADRIIANPNCSTIQLVMVLAPLHRALRIRRVVVSTYQSVTGSGAKGLSQLMHERQGIAGEKFYPHTIDLNLIPEAGDFTENGYTTEEEKLSFETRKIMRDESIRLTATAVRAPVMGGHSESVNIEFEQAFDPENIREILRNAEGIAVVDDPARHEYPMPLDVRGKDEVFVGRIRRDFTIDNGLNLWIVSDNVRKGAATNAVQIARYLISRGLAGN